MVERDNGSSGELSVPMAGDAIVTIQTDDTQIGTLVSLPFPLKGGLPRREPFRLVEENSIYLPPISAGILQVNDEYLLFTHMFTNRRHNNLVEVKISGGGNIQRVVSRHGRLAYKMKGGHNIEFRKEGGLKPFHHVLYRCTFVPQIS